MRKGTPLRFAALAMATASLGAQALVPLENVAALSAGYGHTCAVTTRGGVKCWGWNFHGQLGDNTKTDRLLPVDVVGLGSGVASVSAGLPHTCALTTSGGVKCWGRNSSGELGDNSTTQRLTPVDVFGLTSGVAAISAGESHTCALTTGGGVKCWGYNFWGQLGDGSLPTSPAAVISPVPVNVIGLSSGVAAVASGRYHSCALTTSGGVKCWGDNTWGQLGDNSTADRWAPVDVSGLANGVVAIAAGATQTCAIITGGSVKCWGYGYPQLVGPSTPMDVPGLSGGTSALAMGRFIGTCALTTSGGVKCPDDVPGLTAGVAVVTLGDSHACALTTGGSVKCWGINQFGQLGDGTLSMSLRLIPVDVLVPFNTPGTLSGLWWNANESGSGVHFTQRRNIVFAAWYTYDAAGNPKWYVASNCAMPAGSTGATGSCAGSLYEVNGPTFFGTPFNPAAANVAAAGSLQVAFQGANNASFTYSVAGQSRTIALVRQLFATGSPPGVDYTDLWWNPNESGWGIAVTQQGSAMFLAWYVYDGAGRPVWYVASNCTGSGNGCSGTLYRTTGPAFGPTFDPRQVQVFAAGTVSLVFTDANNGTLSYTVNGVSSSKAITRQLF